MLYYFVISDQLIILFLCLVTFTKEVIFLLLFLVICQQDYVSAATWMIFRKLGDNVAYGHIGRSCKNWAGGCSKSLVLTC